MRYRWEKNVFTPPLAARNFSFTSTDGQTFRSA